MCWHKWGKWALSSGFFYSHGKRLDCTLQYRTCKKCGRTQTKYV